MLSALNYINPINPIVAAIMHVAESSLVVFNSVRLVRYGEDLETCAVNLESAQKRAWEPQAGMAPAGHSLMDHIGR